MDKRATLFVIPLMWLWSLYAGEGVIDALSTLSQSLELLSKHVQTVKKQSEFYVSKAEKPWVNHDVFSEQRKESGELLIKFDYNKLSFANEEVYDKAFNKLFYLYLFNKSSEEELFKLADIRSRTKFEILVPSGTDIKHEMVRLFVEGIFKVGRQAPKEQGYMLQNALVLLFYMESREQGAWNDNFIEGIAFTEPTLNAWQEFMKTFIVAAKVNHWPYGAK